MTTRPFTISELAERWSTSERTVYRIIADGTLRAFRVGGKTLRIAASEVGRWENSGGDPPKN